MALDSCVCPFLFSVVVPTVLETGFLKTNKKVILTLALVCKVAFKTTEPYISELPFRVKKKKNATTLVHYHPKKFLDVSTLSFPPRITHLVFNEKFSENLSNPSTFPPTLTHLKFGEWYNAHISRDVLPDSLVSLGFGEKFNRPLPSVLPSCLKHLWFGVDFNNVIPSLPSQLTHLSFGLQPHVYLWEWHDDVIVDLASSIFFAVQREDKFNQCLKGKLPSSLTHLSLGTCYSFPLSPPKPSAIQFLRVGECYSHSIPFRRLPNLTKLVLGWQKPRRFRPSRISPNLSNLVNFLPAKELDKFDNLTTLATVFAYEGTNQFPTTLKHGYFLNYHQYYSDVSFFLQFLLQFNVMTHLVLHIQGSDLTLSTNLNLPRSLTHLHILLFSGRLDRASITCSTLQQLALPKCHHVELNLPRLTHLSIAKVKKFPAFPSITHLAFGPLQIKFPKKKSIFPSSVTHLKLGPSVSTLPILPSKLAHLTVASHAIINGPTLPSTLKMLKVLQSNLKNIRRPLPSDLQIEETSEKGEGYEWTPVVFPTDW